ncbi:MAG: PKD-like domain-containing protein [Sphingobacteriales bacterium]
MGKSLAGRLFFAVIFFLFTIPAAFAQTITIGAVDPGPYGQGSTIAVPITINDASSCTPPGTKYTLLLSNAAGAFAPGTTIGTYNEFYTTFVNGKIPNVIAGTGYKVEVKSSTGVTSSISNAFTINATPGVIAGVTSQIMSTTYPEIFGQCSGAPNSPFAFGYASTTGAATTATFYNELTKTTEQSNATIPATGSYTFTANTGNYTVSVKATMGGIVGTYDYQLVNNVINTNIGSTGSLTVCLNNNQAPLTINVDISSATGIQFNYPGDVYTVSWGDGSPATVLTLCDIKNLNGQITHIYTKASCGNPVIFQASNDFCGPIGAAPNNTAKVVVPPTNKFTVPATACAGTALTIQNQSDPGVDPNNGCTTNVNALYTWSVDGVIAQSNVPWKTDFVLPATTPAGSHVITLHLQNPVGGCNTTDVSQTICLQSPPQPIFKLPGASVCLSGGSVTPINTSIVDNGCGATNQYIWTVTGPAPVSYAGGTNANSAQPQFVFSIPGIYKIQLAIKTSTSCGTVIAGQQTLVVNDTPIVTLSPNATLCGNNQLLTFDNSPGPTQSTLTGTAQPVANTYTWTITGGAFTFQGGTTANSQYPEILFTDYATYTIQANEQNSCGNVTKTQTITFVQAPTVTAGPPQTICASSPIAPLAGKITGTATSFSWIGGTGTFSAGRNSLTTNYTPSAAEIAAGSVTLTLQANTALPAPCNVIASNITITITPIDVVTSPPAVTICTAQPVNYGITSTSGGSNFTWTASVTGGTATGVAATGSGSTINDVITDTDPNNPAIVVYKITPQNNSCTGNTFTLTVTVDPLPKITAAAVSSPICSNQPAGIALTTNIANTSYTWTSVASPGITGNTNQATAVSTNAIQDVLINNGSVAGTVTYTIIPYNGTCPGPSKTGTVTVQPLPVQSNPGPDDEVCSTTTYSLQGNNPAPGTGKWTIVKGPAGATFSDPADPHAVVNGLVAGNLYQFQWTITATPTCPPSSNAVNITIDVPSIGGTTAGDATVCSSGNNGVIKLSGQQGNILRWESSVDNGATWQPIVNVSTTENYLNLIQTTQYRAVTQSGVCAALPSTATTITVNQSPPQANAGQDASVCNQTFVVLNGNDPGTFKGVWTQTAGPAATIVDPANPQTQVNGLVKGNVYTFTWTINGLPPCGNTTASVNITVSADVTAAFTMDKIRGCGPTTITFTNTSTPSPIGSYLWDFSDGTTSNAITPSPHTFAPSTDGKEITYTVTLTPVSNCGLKTPITSTVTVDPAVPVAVINPSQTAACGAFTLTAQNLSPGNNVSYDFYLLDGNGNTVQHIQKTDKTDATFLPVNPTKVTDYSVYLVATDLCGDKGTSTPIIISVAPSSLISLVQLKGDQQSVCLGNSVVFQNVSTGGNRFTYTIYDSNQNVVATIPGGPGDFNYLPTATGTYYVSITAGDNGCGDAAESPKKEFTVYPDPQPDFSYTLDEQYNVTFTNTTPDDGNTPAASLNYKWDFGDGSNTNTTNKPVVHHYDYEKSPFTVTLTATNVASGCFAVTTKTVIVKFLGNLFFPNAFLPSSTNGELNIFKPKGTQLKTWKLQIFNNFGELIWETTKLDADGSPVEGWDGTYKGVPVQQGVYVWQASATFVNGAEWKGMSYNNSLPKRTGVIHLIR